MNEMYSLDLDRYGPPLEPPEGYYFLTNEQMSEQEDEDDE